MIIRFIFSFSISKEILFSRFNCAFLFFRFSIFGFFSKSRRRSSLRFLLLRSLPAPAKIIISGGGHDDDDDDDDGDDDDDDDDDDGDDGGGGGGDEKGDEDIGGN